MLNLIKKDIILFRKYFAFIFYFYSGLLAIMIPIIMVQKIKPFNFIIYVREHDVDVFLANSYPFILFFAFFMNIFVAFRMIKKDNWSLTFSFTSNRIKIFHAKTIVRIIFTTLNYLLALLTIFIWYSFIKYSHISFSYLTSIVSNDIFAIFMFTMLTIMVIYFTTNLSISSKLLSKFHANIRILVQIGLIITYILTIVIWNTYLESISNGFMRENLNYYINATISTIIICIVVYGINLFLVRRVDV